MKKLYIIFLLSGIFFGATVKGQTTYNDVANIFYKRCTSCHHTGGLGPMPLMNFADCSSMDSSIVHDLNSGKMPPWDPDTTYSRFIDERIITSTEKNLILQWISNGALQGDSTLAPTAPTYNDYKYKLCPTPSLVLKIPTFTSNATPSTNNANPYDCFVLNTNLTKDTWLRAFECVPGNSAIVHHIVVNIDTTGNSTSDLSGNCASEPGQYNIGGWVPGCAPVVFPGQAPLKAGVRIKKGSQIIMQIHYAPGSGGQVDSTQIRLYFYPDTATKIRPVLAAFWLQKWLWTVAANTTVTESTTHAVGNSSISIFSVAPHSHHICTNITNYAENGTTASTIIPMIRQKWHFNWQGNYYYPKLLKVPSGYTIHSDHFYDNTTNNPDNPTPVAVSAGTATTDEMLFDGAQWLIYQTGDENIDIAALLKCDTLLVCKPAAAGLITGTSTVCLGQTGLTFTIPIIDNSATYTWSYSGQGATIHGNGSSVTVDFSANATSGNLTVAGVNTCGVSGAVSTVKAITISGGGAVSAAGTISGTSTVCSGQTGVSYSVPAISNATGYTWSYSGSGKTINGTGTSITIDFSSNATSGNLTVMGTSGCGNGAVSASYPITVNAMPTAPTFTVVTNCGNSVLTASATTGTYLWSPGGGTTKSITVTTGGTYSVTVSTGGSCSATSAGTQVTITSTPTVTGTPATRCGTGTVVLGATASSGTINWYTGSTGGTPLVTATSYTTTSLSTTTTYYADATDNGCTSTPRTAVVATVSNGPTATMSGSTTVCTGSKGIISIALTGNAPWAFTYGSAAGSNPLSGITSSTYTIAVTSGTYTVASVSDAGNCSGTTSGSATIAENSAISVTTATTTCNGSKTNYTVEFDISGGDASSYTITGGPGTKTTNHFKSSSIASGTAYSFSVSDTYNCSPATVNGNPNCGCAATGAISGGGTICNGSASTITIDLAGGTPPYSFVYSIGGVKQAKVINQTATPYTFTTTTIGAYTLDSIFDANCHGSTSGTATVSQTLPAATISGGAAICPGGSTNLSFDLTAGTPPWSFTYSNGTTTSPVITANLSNKQVSVSTAGTYTIVSVSAGSCSGTGSGSAVVTISPLPHVGSVLSSPSTTVCEGSSVTLSGTGATTYTWSDGIVDGQAFIITSGKTYTVTGTDANTTCSNSATQTLTMNSKPSISTSATPSSAAVCIGGSVTLRGTTTGTNPLTYSWSGGITDGQSFAPTVTDTYTVTGTDANNCSNTAPRVVTVSLLPTVSATATPSSTVCAGGSVTLSGSGASTYTWSGNVMDGVSFVPTGTATYTVTGRDVNHCDNTASKTITVTTCNTTGGGGVGIKEVNTSLQEISIYPNPTNGLFSIAIKNASFKELTISVVNMLGTEVFSASDKNNSTDYKIEINLDGLSKGMYYLKLSTGTDAIIKKLIIQ